MKLFKIKNPKHIILPLVILSISLLMVFFVFNSSKTEITVLDIHSHPQAGDNWTISFETKGTADLTITPDDQVSIDDLDFISLTCNGINIKSQQLSGDVINYPNWQCNGIGELTHLVNIAGTHTLKFQFGDQTVYAYNSPDSAGPLSPGTVANVVDPGFDSNVEWTSLDNAKVSDDAHATASIGGTSNRSALLTATNFGFAIPASATINGILVEIEKSNTGTGIVDDAKVQIVKADGTRGTIDKATTDNWPATDTYISYGSSTDLWGETWSAADINDIDFGVAIAALIGSSVAGDTLITTKNGNIKISNIKQGDKVYSYNIETQKRELDEVVAVISNLISQDGSKYYAIRLDDGKVIRVTANHLFYRQGEWIEAQNLKIGDVLTNEDLDGVKITDITVEENTQDTVWNIEVKKNHNFFANGILVHNGGAASYLPRIDHIRITVDYTPSAGSVITVGSTGTQVATTTIPSTNFHVGGAFTFLADTGSATTTQILVSEKGTVNANTNLSNLKLRYETAGTCTYDGDEPYFNETGVSFNASDVATATGTMSVSTSQVCVYPVLDVGSGASADETIEIEITNPSTDVTVSDATVSPTSTVAIADTTTLEAAPTVSCTASTSTTAFGTLTSSTVSTSTPDITITSSTTYTNGFTLSIHDAGAGAGQPGLYSTSTTSLVSSAIATLAAGTEGYGIQAATTTAGSGAAVTLNSIYLKTGDNVGGLSTSDVVLASSTTTFTDREVVVTHKAAISNLTPAAGDYLDTITYSCVGN